MGCKKLTYYESNTALGENWKIFVGGIEKSASGAKKCLNYYAFGSVMPNANNLNAAGHTYGFQGQMNDNEIKGPGNSVNYRFRMHDPRLGRFFAVDPLTSKYPFYTPYSFSGNRLINAVELEGLEPKDVAKIKLPKGGGISAPKIDKVVPKSYTGGLSSTSAKVPLPSVNQPSISTASTVSSWKPNWSLLYNPMHQARLLIGIYDNFKNGQSYFKFNVGVTYGLQAGAKIKGLGTKLSLYGNAVSEEFIRYEAIQEGTKQRDGLGEWDHKFNYYRKNGKINSSEGFGVALFGGYEYQKNFITDMTKNNRPRIEKETIETISLMVVETTLTNGEQKISQNSNFVLGFQVAALIGIDAKIEIGVKDKP